jgi:hypothetical protein
MVYEVPVLVPLKLFLYISYPVTAKLSVEAVHDKVVVVSVVPETSKLLGAVGACESAVGLQTRCTYSG